MFRFLLFLSLLLLSKCLAAPGVTYDQRQEGKVNVQVDIKDVQIVALLDSDTLEDYMNYDYSYDYSDFTIKPSSRPTTSKPSSTSADSLNIWPTTPINTENHNTNVQSLNDSSTEIPESSSPTTLSSNVTEENEALKLNSTTIATTSNDSKNEEIQNSTTESIKIEDQKQEKINSTSTSDVKPDGIKKPAGIAEPRKRCPVGFHLKSGKCFKRRLSLISPRQAFLKLAPALLSKAQLLGGQMATKS